jgi:hypothetical protein
MNKRMYKWAVMAVVIVVAAVSLWLVQPFGQGPAKAVGRSVSDLPKHLMGSGTGYAMSPVAPGDYRDLVPPKRSPRDLKLVCSSVEAPPVIDGVGNETVWAGAKKITTLDFSSQRTINIASVHTPEMIFFLVTYPDVSPSTTHKSFGWDDGAKIYKPSNDREDMFVFKWSMQGLDADLTLRGRQPHQADVWFWKACRTNPVGFSDDKHHTYSHKQSDGGSKIVFSSENAPIYLLRSGDSGQSAYQEKIALDHTGPFVPRFSNRQPTSSRADVSAKGIWREGLWTIEFARKLNTGHDDDAPFAIGGEYLFIVSCYEMSGDTVRGEWSQPLYRTGDGFDRIVLDVAQ